MNIFALHNDPKTCARMHCDQHVVKMLLEHAQMMCTAHHLFTRYDIDYDIPYKITHINHPCTKWVRKSSPNYKWLYNMSYYLNEEYKRRYDKNVNHKSFDVINSLPVPRIPNFGLTKFAQAMPDEYKHDDYITAYRSYYVNDKIKFTKFTNTINWTTSKAFIPELSK